MKYSKDKSARKISIALLVPFYTLHTMQLCTAQIPEYTPELAGIYGAYGAHNTHDTHDIHDIHETEAEKDGQSKGDYGDYGEYNNVEDVAEQMAPDAPPDVLVDTSDDSTGNWYEKLRFLKSAKAQYDELNKLLARVKEQEGSFGIQLKKIQEQITNFYTRVRINLQALPETIRTILTDLKPIQERVPTTEEERLELVEAADKQKALEQLQQEFDLLQKVYAEFEKAYTKDSVAQLKQAEQYQERALDSFEQLEKTRSHEKAHELYKLVENSKENIISIVQYLQNLQNYGTQVQTKVQQLMSRIQASIEHLEKQGVAIRPLSEQEKAQLLAEQQKQQEQERLKKEQREREKAERDRWAGFSWYQKLFEYMRQAGAWVLSKLRRS